MLGPSEGGAFAKPPGAETAALPGQGADGTLLAVVPIPGTDTSLAIVGYPVPAGLENTATGTLPVPAAYPVATGRPVGEHPGLRLDYDQRRGWVGGGAGVRAFPGFEALPLF